MKRDASFPKTPKETFLYAVRPYRGRIVFMYACIIVGNALTFTVPYILSRIANILSAMGPSSFAFHSLTGPLLLVIAALVGAEIIFRIGHVTEVGITLGAFNRVTSRLYAVLLNQPAEYFEDKFSGEISRRVEQIGSSVIFFVDNLPWEFGWPAVGLVMTAFLLWTASPLLLAVFGAWLVFFAVPSYFLLRKQYQVSKLVAEKYADLNGTIVDVLGGMPTVQAFASGDFEEAYYRRYMDKALAADKRARWMFVVNKFQQGMSIAILGIALTLAGAYLFANGSIQIGGFVIIAAVIPSFTGIAWSIGDTVTHGITNFGQFKNAVESLAENAGKVADDGEELAPRGSGIELDRVSFAYPKSPSEVLSDIDLRIAAGEKVGLVGRSGAGKSTIVKLLLRLYEPSSGAVKIGGQDIVSSSLGSLRRYISFVPQDTALFHRSLYENILYAKPDATKEEVIEASRRAHAHDFIEKYPDGYETLVGERGVKLSGGQRQRIALARAMLKNSPILVLDEATSSLDTESEEIVQEGLQELFKNRTVLAVAHRLSTLRAMDRIIVLEDGQIIEDGAPQDLLKKVGGAFKTMWERQKNGFV